MSAVDNKKAKRRRSKNNTVTKSNASSNVSNNTPQGSHFSLGENGEAEKLEKLMDASDDSDMPLPTFPRGPNPYLDRERCLICGCERQDPPQAEKILAEMDGDAQKNTDVHELTQLPLWVCPSCRRAADSELEKKSGVDINLEQELHLDTSSLPFLPEVSLGGASEPTTPNGTLCTCEACTERRYHDWQIEAEHERETQELQKCWTDLRTIVRTLYGADDPALSEEDGVKIKDLVCRLCSRDPHQLFLRLESQVREFVIEKKVRLLKQLNCGYKSPPQAKEFISLLLDEYNQLCLASRLTAEYLTDLKEHIKKFNVTWELHNKHLFQSIVYTDPAIHNSLHLVIDQLRRGAASKESYNEDTYPNLLHRFLKFQDEMSVILVVWRDCQQLIEAYNEEQTALKVKQKWLKEDWEFFKAQRKLLEQQVLKKQPKDRLSHSMEVQFTETMRNMLTGTKPAHEECFCPRCNRKRCTCDECTITHMITCGIINPDALENNNHTHTFNFPHDPSRYVIDVDPPSMSSTSSSSGSSSPIMVERNRLTLPFENEENEDIPEEIDSQSEDEEDDGDEDEDDEDDEDEDDEDDVEDDEVEGAEGSQESSSAGDGGSGGSPTDMDLGDKRMQAWVETEALKLMEKTDTCDCHHCVTQTQAEQLQKVEDNQCQCHVCLQQQGQTVSTSLPQHVPITPRPADLHIYPHIHGSPGLHSLQARNMRSILQPQLYDLHGPLRQAKLPVKLDFDNPENIQDHLYHAYGDWDNTPYDPRVVIGGYRYGGGLGSDLLPPPPLTTNSPYPPEPLSSVSQTATTTTTCTTTSALNNHLANAITKSMDRSNDHQVKPVLSDSCAKCSEPVSSLSSSLSSSGSQPHGPPCTRPATLGGNTQVQQTGVKQPHTHCKKHVNGKTTSQPSHNHSLQAHGGLQGVQSDLLKNSPRNKDELSRPLRNSSLNPHPCSHANTRNASAVHQTQGDSHAGCCPSSVPMATTVNNVSVGTSTVCTDPDCDAHHDDNCDSIDDSCSEQSSSTSTSNNQKEGSKYCDCCYCEFFGHGNPPVAQTSKNYAEMRERLRRRLKRKTEAKTGEDRGGLTELTMESSCSHSKLADPLEMKGLEELLRFINGTEESKKEEKAQSSKAAKRARRKQRLAEEKAREEDRRQMEEEEKKKKIKEEKKKKEGLLRHLEERFSSSSEFESSTGSLKKKKGKHKEKSETILSAPLPTSVPPTQLSCRSVPRPIESAKPAKVETIVERKQEVIKGRDNTPSPKQVLKTSGSGSAPTTPTKDLRQQAMTDKSHTMTPDRQRRAKTAQRITPSNDTAVSYQPKPNTTLQPTPTILSKQPAQPAKQTAQQKPLQNNVPKTTNNTRKAIPPQPTPIQNHVDSQPEVDLSKKGKKKVVTPLVQPTASQPLPKSTHKQNGSILNSVQIVQAPSHSNGKFVDVTMGKDAKITSNGVVSKGNGELLIRPGKNHKLADKKQETGAPEQNKIGKGKKNKKKNKGADGCVDEIFMPRSESDLENGDMDEVERELEEFKRFCFDSPQPQKKEKLQVNFNLKDIFSKKKSGLGCS